jgi:hypothetical protein
MAPLVMVEEKDAGRDDYDGMIKAAAQMNSRHSGPIAGQAGKQDSNNEFKHWDSFGLGSGKIRTVKLRAAKHRYPGLPSTATQCGQAVKLRAGSV